MRSLLFAFASMTLCSGLAQGLSASQVVLTGDLGYASCPSAAIAIPSRMYVVASLPDAACGGIAGAEFRIAGFPTQAEGWIVVPAWPPGVQPTGDPFTEGVRLAFDCDAPENGVVVLLAFDVIALTPIVDRAVSVTAHQAPSVPGSTCPLLTLCDQDATQICAQGSETRVNDTSGGFCYCNDGCLFPACPTVSVTSGTWSQVKQLYID